MLCIYTSRMLILPVTALWSCMRMHISRGVGVFTICMHLDKAPAPMRRLGAEDGSCCSMACMPQLQLHGSRQAGASCCEMSSSVCAAGRGPAASGGRRLLQRGLRDRAAKPAPPGPRHRQRCFLHRRCRLLQPGGGQHLLASMRLRSVHAVLWLEARRPVMPIITCSPCCSLLGSSGLLAVMRDVQRHASALQGALSRGMLP